MTLYKDLNGNIHDDMDGKAKEMLPSGCFEITKAEADAMLALKGQAELNALSYAQKRALAYPPITDLADGLVKQSSTDLAIKAAGDAQIAKYHSDCLAVKTMFPKPI